MKIKLTFCGVFLSIASLLWGQKIPMEYGIRLGIYNGLNGEFTSFVDNASLPFNAYRLTSTLAKRPSYLIGVTAASQFDHEGNQWRIGVETYTFGYEVATAVFPKVITTPPTNIFSNTFNRVLQIPVGYCRKRGRLFGSLGSGIAVFFIKDNSTAEQKLLYTPKHIEVLDSTIHNFTKAYPIFEGGIGWRWIKSSIELNYHTATFLFQDPIYGFQILRGGRSFICLSARLYL
ncbi:MAG: hypothetical protein RLZZ292_3669 [Bacteroidota bacterium]|jgi:hypothetical protein